MLQGALWEVHLFSSVKKKKTSVDIHIVFNGFMYGYGVGGHFMKQPRLYSKKHLWIYAVHVFLSVSWEWASTHYILSVHSVTYLPRATSCYGEEFVFTALVFSHGFWQTFVTVTGASIEMECRFHVLVLMTGLPNGSCSNGSFYRLLRHSSTQKQLS